MLHLLRFFLSVLLFFKNEFSFLKRLWDEKNTMPKSQSGSASTKGEKTSEDTFSMELSSGDETAKRTRKQRSRWTEAETDKLIEVVTAIGDQHWEKASRIMEGAHYIRGAKQCKDHWRLLKRKAIDASLPPRPSSNIRSAEKDIDEANDSEGTEEDKESGEKVPTKKAKKEGCAEVSPQQKKILAVIAKDLPIMQSDPTKPSGRIDLSEVEKKVAAKVEVMKKMKQEKKMKADAIEEELLATTKKMAASVDRLTGVRTALLAQQLGQYPVPRPAPPPADDEPRSPSE